MFTLVIGNKEDLDTVTKGIGIDKLITNDDMNAIELNEIKLALISKGNSFQVLCAKIASEALREVNESLTDSKIKFNVNSILKITLKEVKKNSKFEINARFCPPMMAKLLTHYFSTIPIWSQLMLGDLKRHSDDYQRFTKYKLSKFVQMFEQGEKYPKTTSLAETVFRTLKHIQLVNYKHSRIDEFIADERNFVMANDQRILVQYKNRLINSNKLYQPESEKWGAKQAPLSKTGNAGKYQRSPAVPIQHIKNVRSKDKDKQSTAKKQNQSTDFKRTPKTSRKILQPVIHKEDDQDYETADKLIEKMASKMGYSILDPFISHDGNCLFESITSAIKEMNYPYRERCDDFRQKLVNYLRKNRFCAVANIEYAALISPNYYKAKMALGNLDFENLEERWNFYLDDMVKSHTYGDEVILRAASEYLEIGIKIITCDPDPIMYFYTPPIAAALAPIVLGVYSLSVQEIDTGHYMPLQKTVQIPLSLHHAHNELTRNLTVKKDIEMIPLFECMYYLTEKDKEIALAEENREVLLKIQESLLQHGFTLPVNILINDSNGDCKLGHGKFTVIAALRNKIYWIPTKVIKQNFTDDQSKKVFQLGNSVKNSMPSDFKFFGFPIIKEKGMQIMHSSSSSDTDNEENLSKFPINADAQAERGFFSSGKVEATGKSGKSSL